MQQARQQWKPVAVVAIENAGGRVLLRNRLFGERPILSVYLAESRITDTDLGNLVMGLNHFVYLNRHGEWIDLDDNTRLGGLTPNRLDLYLRDTQITDAALEHLRMLHQLTSLDLTGTQVTDKGVKKLQQALPNCKITQ